MPVNKSCYAVSIIINSKLEQFLNSLEGEVVTIVPNVKPTFQGMGATASVDFLLNGNIA